MDHQISNPSIIYFILNSKGFVKVLIPRSKYFLYAISINLGIPQFPTDLVTFTEKIPNGKLHFLCSAIYMIPKRMCRSSTKVN